MTKPGVFMQNDNFSDLAEVLVCPETKLKLTLCPSAEAQAKVGAPLLPSPRSVHGESQHPRAFGATPLVLLREDHRCAYPVFDGIPILLVPEMLTAPDQVRSFDLQDPKYSEAYEEMEHYNCVAKIEAEEIVNSESYKIISPVIEATNEQLDSFPHPRSIWLDAIYDCVAQWEAYEHISPIRAKRVLQVGGKGIHAVKFLLAGAAEAWVVTPVLGEAQVASALAQVAGVSARLRCVVAIAEELPLATNSFDAVYSGGCVHHMVTEIALPEMARVLREGGKFAAVDPWRVPLMYALGTKLFGKREPNVYCRPLTPERIEALRRAFRESRAVQHGTLTRYPLLVLSKLGVRSRLSVVWQLNKVDDVLCSLLPRFRAFGSSVALLAIR